MRTETHRTITAEDSIPSISNPRQFNFVDDVDFIEDPSQERT